MNITSGLEMTQAIFLMLHLSSSGIWQGIWYRYRCTQSAHIQTVFLREVLSFVLNGSYWTVSRPNLTLEFGMLYSCGVCANEPCQTLGISASVTQIISKLDNSTTDAWELVLAADTSVIASAVCPSTPGWFSLDPTKLKSSNWRSTS